MALKVYSAGSWVTAKGVKVYSSGTWVDAKAGKVRSAGSWVDFLTTILLNNHSISIYGAGTATATYEISSSGFVNTNKSTPTTREQWCTPSSNVGDYEVRATQVSGDTLIGSATGSWLSLASSQGWSLNTSSGFVTAELAMEIRRAGSVDILETATITLYAEILG